MQYLGAGYDQLVFPKHELKPLIHQKLAGLCSEGSDFLQKMLAWGISERLSPSQALSHPYLASSRARGKDERMQMIVSHLLALSSVSSPSNVPATAQSHTQSPAIEGQVRAVDSNDSIRQESCNSDTSLGLHKLRVVNLLLNESSFLFTGMLMLN